MKKFGIVLLVAGIVLMGITAFKFVKDKNRGSEEQVQDENLPFPWMPTTGAVLIAGGIILMGSGGFKRVR
jgi:hypothetical protein